MSDHVSNGRYAVGTISVTPLFDGTLHENTGVLHGIDPDAASALLVAASLPSQPVLDISAFLVRTDGLLVLIDTGCGDGMGPQAGRLMTALGENSIAPGDIDLVLLTHMHPDHIGGLLQPDGGARFPRARVIAPAGDAAVFLDVDIAAGVPDAVKPVFAKARAVALAYAGRFETLEDQSAPAPNITAVSLPGHSPGHTGYRLSSGGESLLIWGDVVHVPALQFQCPEVGMIFDADPGLAEKTRRSAFDTAARTGEAIAGMHMPFPAVARVVVDSGRFGFVPLAMSPPATTSGDGA